jgi:hypothetical protein
MNLTCKKIDNTNPDWPNCNAWECCLARDGQQYAFTFYKGDAGEPTLDEVLRAFKYDLINFGRMDLEDFCYELCYNQTMGKRVYDALQKQNREVSRMFPEWE